MLTSKDKTDLINIIKKIDVKDMTIEHESGSVEKWFRFGNYNALKIVTEIIKQLPEPKKRVKKIDKQTIIS